MTTLDIRTITTSITEIKYDLTTDVLIDSQNKGKVLAIKDKDNKKMELCAYEDLDNFILACQKAKKLWHKTG